MNCKRLEEKIVSLCLSLLKLQLTEPFAQNFLKNFYKVHFTLTPTIKPNNSTPREMKTHVYTKSCI